MKRIIEYLVAWIGEHEKLDKDQRDIVAYGLDIMISTLLTTLAVLCLGLLFGSVLEAAIYLAVTIPIRTNGGGYHAKTHWGCFVLQCCSFSSVHILAYFSSGIIPIYLLILICVVELFVIVCKAPVEHPNNPLSEEARIAMKRRCIVLTSLFAVAGSVVFYFYSRGLGTIVVLSIMSASLSLLASNKSKENGVP